MKKIVKDGVVKVSWICFFLGAAIGLVLGAVGNLSLINETNNAKLLGGGVMFAGISGISWYLACYCVLVKGSDRRISNAIQFGLALVFANSLFCWGAKIQAGEVLNFWQLGRLCVEIFLAGFFLHEIMIYIKDFKKELR
jgi:hypothetical protein